MMKLMHYWSGCVQEDQYARWMGAFRLASKGHTMADSSYDSEVKSIQAFLSMQHPSSSPVLNPRDANFQPENFVAARFLRRLKTSRQVCSLSSTFIVWFDLVELFRGHCIHRSCWAETINATVMVFPFADLTLLWSCEVFPTLSFDTHKTC